MDAVARPPQHPLFAEAACPFFSGLGDPVFDCLLLLLPPPADGLGHILLHPVLQGEPAGCGLAKSFVLMDKVSVDRSGFATSIAHLGSSGAPGGPRLGVPSLRSSSDRGMGGLGHKGLLGARLSG